MHLLTSEFAVHFQTNTLNRAELLYRIPPHFLSDFNLPIDFVRLEVFVLEEPASFIFRVIKQLYPEDGSKFLFQTVNHSCNYIVLEPKDTFFIISVVLTTSDLIHCCCYRCGMYMAGSCTAVSHMITQLHLFPGLQAETYLLLVPITH